MKSLLFIFFLLLAFNSVAQPLKVGSSPAVSSAGVYLAYEEGYFRDEGLEVELVTIANSGASMTLLLSKGELDVGAGNLSSGLFNAILSGEKFKIVADKGHTGKGREYIALVVRDDHFKTGRFKTLKDLKGFKVGLTALNGVSQQIVFDKILRSVSLTDKDIQYIKLSYPEMNSAMKAKNLDATIQLEPYLAAGILDKTFRIVENSQKFLPNQQSAAIFYSPAMTEKKREQGIKFMKAYLRGVRLYNQALEDQKLWLLVVKQLQKHIKIENAEVWNKMIPVGLHNDGKLDIDSLMSDLEWYKSKGYIAKVPNKDEVFDTSIASEAVKLLDASKKRREYGSW